MKTEKKTWLATFWRVNPQLKNGGYTTTRTFENMTRKQAEKKVEKTLNGQVYGSMEFVNLEEC